MNDFSQIMSERTDEQLIEIVKRKREEYQPEALEAADAEFSRRDLSADAVVEAEQVLSGRATQERQKAEAPLGGIWKVLAFLFPGFIFFLALLLLRAEGRQRQSRELGRWTLYGIAFYIVLFILIKSL